MTFNKLISTPEILRAIEEAGYKEPTPIQEKAIPMILAGSDLRASAQTGTGKTAAFLLPILSRLLTPSPVKGKGPRVLILVPTRELAMQVAQESIKYTKYLPQLKTVCIYGGAPYHTQNRDLSRYCEILVATPGRLMDHMERGNVNFSRLEVFILDEADRMLDMGFIGAVEEIAASTPKTRQTLLFSATLKGNVMKLSNKLLKNPLELSIAASVCKHENIGQFMHKVIRLEHKYQLLNNILKDPSVKQTIIFTATKREAGNLTNRLQEAGEKVDVLHGDIKQRHRTRTIAGFREGKTKILVATDVAARGIDVPAISHVINFDLPQSEEDYIHRIGRTGRAGARGIALSFVSPKDIQMMRRIERFTGQTITLKETSPLEGSFRREEPRFERERNRNQRPRSAEEPRFGHSKRRFGSGRKDARKSGGSRPSFQR